MVAILPRPRYADIFPFSFIHNSFQDEVFLPFNFITHMTFSVGNSCLEAVMSTSCYFEYVPVVA